MNSHREESKVDLSIREREELQKRKWEFMTCKVYERKGT